MADIASNTDIQIATDSVFSTIVSEVSGPYRTTKAFVNGDLPYGVTLFARARHRHETWGNTPWSATLEFQLIVPANIIGICLDNSGTKGTFSWIDANGNKLENFDPSTHPIYKNMTMATVDDARAPVTMTKIPLFYLKTAASGPVGTFADGKKCWWISDLKALGYRPAACFKRSTSKDATGKYVISQFVYIGTYLSHSETVGGANSIGSKKGVKPLTAQSKTTCKTYISNRNSDVAGITGFRMFDIWDLGALRLLMVMARGKTDAQTAWGDNASNTSAPNTGATAAKVIFKGTSADPQVFIDDMWKCYWYYADLISITNGIVSLGSPIDLTAAISFGNAEMSRYTTPSDSGWIKDILDCPMVVGDDTHDLLELFIPKTVASAETQATFSDYFGMNDAAGEIFVCGSANFSETYQSYEVTGSNSVSYWAQYASGCPNRTYYSTQEKTYLQQYGGSCPNLGGVCYTDNQHYNAHAAGCTMPNKGYYGEVGYTGCKAGSNVSVRNWTWLCGYCNQYLTTTHRNWASCYPPGAQYPSGAGFSPSCSVSYSTASSGYKCAYSGGTCASSGCPYTYTSTPIYGYVTRTRTTNFTNEPGIFAMNKGLKFMSQNTGTYACRMSKN